MHPISSHHPATDMHAASDAHALVSNQEYEYNTNEGSEFIDDAIRMQEQPLMRNEENVAATNYENFS